MSKKRKGKKGRKKIDWKHIVSVNNQGRETICIYRNINKYYLVEKRKKKKKNRKATPCLIGYEPGEWGLPVKGCRQSWLKRVRQCVGEGSTRTHSVVSRVDFGGQQQCRNNTCVKPKRILFIVQLLLAATGIFSLGPNQWFINQNKAKTIAHYRPTIRPPNDQKFQFSFFCAEKKLREGHPKKKKTGVIIGALLNVVFTHRMG